MKPKKKVNMSETEPEKDRKEYDAHERRKEIFDLIIKAGHPKSVSQTQLAKIYGVSQVMIHKDFRAIAEKVKKELPNDAEFITHVVFQSAIRSLSKGDNADKYKAAMLAKYWNDYLYDIGAGNRTKIELNQFNETNIQNTQTNNMVQLVQAARTALKEQKQEEKKKEKVKA